MPTVVDHPTGSDAGRKRLPHHVGIFDRFAPRITASIKHGYAVENDDTPTDVAEANIILNTSFVSHPRHASKRTKPSG